MKPKNEAMAIGAAKLMMSARRSPKNNCRSLRTMAVRARRGMSVSQGAAGEGQEDRFEIAALAREVRDVHLARGEPGEHGGRSGAEVFDVDGDARAVRGRRPRERLAAERADQVGRRRIVQL